MEESRKVYGWLVRGGNAEVVCSSMWAYTMRGEYYCGNLLWQSSLTLLFTSGEVLLGDLSDSGRRRGARRRENPRHVRRDERRSCRRSL